MLQGQGWGWGGRGNQLPPHPPATRSELAIFYENGPFKLTEDMERVEREYGWDVNR